MLIRRYPAAWGGTHTADEWWKTVRDDERVDGVRDALLDIHRIRLLTNQAQRGSATAFSRSFLVSEKARLAANYHALVETLIHHYVQWRPPEALAAVEEALATLQHETASFAAAVESASLEVRAKHLRRCKHAQCGSQPGSDASVAWADACAEVIVQACLATIRRGPADCAVRFYRAVNGRWVAQRRVLIVPPQVHGKEGPIFLPPVMLDERLPLTMFADLLVRPTALSFPLGLLAPFPGWEATGQWQRIRGRIAAATTATTATGGAEEPLQRPTGQNVATQHGHTGHAGHTCQLSAAVPAMISAVTHQYLYPCRSEELGLMWPAFACELSDPDELAPSVSGVSA